MQPYLDPSITKLGPWDTAEMKARYPNAAVPTPPPAVPPTGPGGGGFDVGNFLTGIFGSFIKTYLQKLIDDGTE